MELIVYKQTLISKLCLPLSLTFIRKPYRRGLTYIKHCPLISPAFCFNQYGITNTSKLTITLFFKYIYSKGFMFVGDLLSEGKIIFLKKLLEKALTKNISCIGSALSTLFLENGKTTLVCNYKNIILRDHSQNCM